MTGVFACQIMPRRERCVASPWVGSHGYSPAPIAADSALPPCIASSSRLKRTTWIRKPGWPTSWPGSPSTRSTGSTNSCLGTGDLFKRASVRRPDLVCHHKRLYHHIRRRNARRGCGLATRTLDRHVLRRRLPARLRRRRGWRPGLHRVRYRVPQANHRRQKGGRRSAAADPIDEIELLRCSPHADDQLSRRASNYITRHDMISSKISERDISEDADRLHATHEALAGFRFAVEHSQPNSRVRMLGLA